MKRSLIGLFLAILLAFSAFILGCNREVDMNKTISQIPYSDGINEKGEYDGSLFYRNDLLGANTADPCVIYVPKERDEYNGGYFYAYYTGTEYGIMRSTDLVTWQYVGKMLNFQQGDWYASGTCWAPDVRYNDSDGRYYLYMTSRASNYMAAMGYVEKNNYANMHLSVAVSDTPVGPFTLYEGTNAIGEVITRSMPAFDFRKEREDSYLTLDEGIIDAHLFVDANGDKYLYFSSSDEMGGNCIYGVKMLDWVTPDYSTFKRLLRPGYVSINGGAAFNEGGRSKIHEAPWMLFHDGRYYLGYSNGSFTSRLYSVFIATATSPLGPYEKITEENDGISLGIEAYHDHMGGTGHNTFLEYGGEIWNIYHAHKVRATGNGNPRPIAIDKVEWVYNENLGYDMPYTNGPTYSLQPLPQFVSGYTNVARNASVTIKNGTAEGKEYLTDGIFTTRDANSYREFLANGKVTVEITLPQAKSVAGIMIYNSFSYEYAFSQIDEIVLYTPQKPEGFKGKFNGTVTVKNLKLNPAYYYEAKDEDEESFMRPGGSALYQFAEMPVTKITVTVSKKLAATLNDKTIGISEITVLGR